MPVLGHDEVEVQNLYQFQGQFSLVHFCLISLEDLRPFCFYGGEITLPDNFQFPYLLLTSSLGVLVDFLIQFINVCSIIYFTHDL